MARRWYVLAVVVGGLAAAAVWYWPEGPRWRSGPNAGRLEGFSPDGSILFTSRTPYWNWKDRCLDPEVLRWDVVTGRLLSRVLLPCTDTSTARQLRLSADGRTVLVGEGMVVGPGSQQPEITAWYLHDGVTGVRRGEAVPGVGNVSFVSPDGRWFRGTRRRPGDDRRFSGGSGIYSALTGELVADQSERDGRRVGQCLFAPDGATAVVSWLSTDHQAGTARRVAVQAIELPSGRERGRFELPPRKWGRFTKWDGQCLEIIENVPEGPAGHSLQRACTFDLSRGPVGAGVMDPWLSVQVQVDGGPGWKYWIDGPGWVAYCGFVAPLPPPPAWLNKLTATLGVSPPPADGLLVTARFVDRATGATRYELPRPVGHAIMVTPDGRRLVGRGPGDAVEVWDVVPRLRWPGTLAAGVVGAGGMLALGRFRGRAARPEKMSGPRFPVDSPSAGLIITKLPTE